MIEGQDWSSFQAEEPSTAGLAFVFVKRTEGLDYVNPKAKAQVAHARANGLVVGHYHYPHIANSASAEADYFLKELGSDLHAGDVLALDWEWYGQTVSNAQARAYKDAFVSRIRLKAPSHRIVVYCNRSDWVDVDTDSNCGDGLWIADPTTAGKPRVQHAWTFHQYSTSDGIDHDAGNFETAAALREWAGATVAPAKPKPAAKPKVSLAHVIAAAKADPKAKQGHTTHAADVKPVEAALHAEGLVAEKYATDGSFGSLTVAAYAKWQEHCGYHGKDADGIPGRTTLTKLGDRHGFTVTN